MAVSSRPADLSGHFIKAGKPQWPFYQQWPLYQSEWPFYQGRWPLYPASKPQLPFYQQLPIYQSEAKPLISYCPV